MTAHHKALYRQIMTRLGLIYLWTVNDLSCWTDAQEVERLTRVLERIDKKPQD